MGVCGGGSQTIESVGMGLSSPASFEVVKSDADRSGTYEFLTNPSYLIHFQFKW